MKNAFLLVVFIAVALQGLDWLTRDRGIPPALVAQKTSRDAPGKSGVQTLSARQGLEPVDVRQEGRVTVVEFFATWCPACKRMPSNYQQLLTHRPDVSVRRLQLDDDYDFRRAREDFGIRLCAVPHITIFDANGNLVSQDICSDHDGTDVLFDWINAEILKAGRPRSSG